MHTDRLNRAPPSPLNGYGLETRALEPRCRPFGHLHPSQAASPANRRIRKRNDRREVPGRAGRVKEGWEVPIRPGCSVRAIG